jgi:hypothetical protein
MATTLDFKDVIDYGVWRPRAPALAAAGAGFCLTYDMSNTNADRTKNVYAFRATTALDLYEPTTNDWMPLTIPTMAGTFGAGAAAIFFPSHGPRGGILSGATTTTLQVDGLFNEVAATPGVGAAWTRALAVATVTWNSHPFQVGQQLLVTVSSDVTAIPLGIVTITTIAANTFSFACLNAGATSGTLTVGVGVAPNQLANRGDGQGYTIRVIDSGSGGSGKIEERKIVGNTGGTQPTIEIDSALTFTPVTGSRYEIRCGRVYMITPGAPTAGQFKYYDPATNTFSGNLAVTNLPTVGTDSAFVALSEDHVPNNREPGSGFVNGGATYDGAVNCIAATTTGATSITGSGMPAGLLADEYRNFQVRIVEDTTTPTAVGQRRRITTHTSGAAGVFTVASAWTVTPSATAKFVIENDDDRLLFFTAQTAVYTYSRSGNAWDTTSFAAAPVAAGAGVFVAQAFGIVPDTQKTVRHGMIYRVRGGNVASIDVLNIAGGATGTWEPDIWYNKRGQTFTTGTSGAYDPITFGGRFLHLNVNGTQRFVRFDVRNRVLDPGSYLPFPPGVAAVGGKCAMVWLIDGSTKLGELINVSPSQAQAFGVLVTR